MTGRARQLLRRAAVRAAQAPSVHNTQPWHFVIDGDALLVYADRGRRLQVLDPRGRQMYLSCGCAVLNARVGLAAAGTGCTVERFPDPRAPELVARLVPSDSWAPDPRLAELDAVVSRRHTNRRRFGDEPVPERVMELLCAAAHREGAELVPIRDDRSRSTIIALSAVAGRVQASDEAYLAELRQWTTDDLRRRDGIAAPVVPYRGDGSAAAGDLAAAHPAHQFRELDTTGMGWLPSLGDSLRTDCLALLGTHEDGPAAWVAAGEALERVLLELTLLGYAATPLTQIVEVSTTNASLREQLRLTMQPHILVRIGRAPLVPATRRRRIIDVLTEADRPGEIRSGAGAAR